MRRLVLAACLAAAIGGCGKTPKLTVAGSTAFTPVASKLADAFKAKHPGITIDIQSVGSRVGIKNLHDGVCDIGMADFPEIPNDAKDLKAVPVSRDGIAVVVNPKNPVDGLTMDQVAKIFDGTIANWKDVGGPDAAITVVSREENSGSRLTFDTYVRILGRVTKKAQSQPSNGACRSQVASDPNAISYLTMVQVDATVKPLKLGGVEPVIGSVRDGKYAIAATDFLFTKGEPAGLAKEFIDFALSAEGQKIIQDAGLAPPAK